MKMLYELCGKIAKGKHKIFKLCLIKKEEE